MPLMLHEAKKVRWSPEETGCSRSLSVGGVMSLNSGELFVYGVFDTSPWHLHRMSGLRMKITGEAQRLDTTDSETNKSIRDVKTSMATLADKVAIIYRASSIG